LLNEAGNSTLYAGCSGVEAVFLFFHCKLLYRGIRRFGAAFRVGLAKPGKAAQGRPARDCSQRQDTPSSACAILFFWNPSLTTLKTLSSKEIHFFALSRTES
jgi:hypothetical protein